MCGITGIFNFDGNTPSKKVIEEMTESLKHRGPDGKGIFLENNIALGHRRLKILDLTEKGSQPMTTEDNSVVISYNGEIYNFKEIKEELLKKGYPFESLTDTEVVLYAYKEWGIGCIKKFNGMFAFVLWDKKKKKGYLVRDRYGVKPLYYFKDNKKLIVASEIKAILKHPNVKVELDYKALDEYITFQNIFSNRTLFKGINILEMGSYILFTESTFDIVKYWDYDFLSNTKNHIALSSIKNRLIQTFEKAVVRQMISDVPVSCYLSSGVDSTSITVIASKHSKYINTFSCGFDMKNVGGFEKSFNESEGAKETSKILNTKHYSILVKAKDMENVMLKLIYHFEEPRMGMSFPTFLIAKLASKYNKVVLSGVGGDELFGGYVWRYNYAVGNRNYEDYLSKAYNYWKGRLIGNEEQKSIFTKDSLNEIGEYDTKNTFVDLFYDKRVNPKDNGECINNALRFEAKTFLHGLFILEDKMSMAHSLESRVPFMDNEVVDLARAIPLKYKLGNYDELMKITPEMARELEESYIESSKGKLILREALGSFIPKEAAFRKKQGFSAPLAEWIRKDGRKYIENILLSDRTLNRGILNPEFIKKKIKEHIERNINNRLIIWSLLSFEYWCRIWLDGEKPN